MAERNRVTPGGDIVAIDQRGLFMGNRGSIHRGHEIVRPWQVRRWITCALEHKGWVAPQWQPGRWTALFFWDEAVALAAGHRPCALCRRAEFNAWLDAWESAFGERPRVDPMDRRLHADRRDGTRQRHHPQPWADLPVGTFVALATPLGTAGPHATSGGDTPTDESGGAPLGSSGGAGVPAVVLEDRVVPWSPAGYGTPRERPHRGDATVLTPRATVEVLRHGYEPVIHPAPGTNGYRWRSACWAAQ